MRFGILVSLFLLLGSCPVLGQNKSYIDSLINIENSSANDSIKFQALNKLAIAYSDSAYEKSLSYWHKALALAKRKRNRQDIAHVHHQIGFMLLNKGEFPTALEELNNALTVHRFVGNKKGMAQVYNDIGLIYKSWGRYELALENYLSALTLFDEISDDEGIAMASNNIGQIYYFREEYPRAIEYFEKYLTVNQRSQHPRAVAGAANNIASAYLELKDYDRALENYQKSLRIYDSLGVKLGIAILQDNIGTLYSKKEQFSDALLYHFNALEIFNELKSRPRIGYVLMNIGLAYYKLNDLQNALKYLLDSKSIAEELKQKESLKEIYMNLSDVYNALNKHKEALHFHKRFVLVKDSLMNLETAEKLTTVEARYEADKKSRELMLMKVKLERQKKVVLITAAIGILFLFLFALLIRENLQKRNALATAKEKTRNLHKSLQWVLKPSNSDLLYLQNSFSNFLSIPVEINNSTSNYFWVKHKQSQTFILTVCFGSGLETTDFIKIHYFGLFVKAVDECSNPDAKCIVSTINEYASLAADNATEEMTKQIRVTCFIYNKTNQSLSCYGQSTSWVITNNKILVIPGISNPIDSNSTELSLQRNDSFYLLSVCSNEKIATDQNQNLNELIERALLTSINEPFTRQFELIASSIDFWKNSIDTNEETLFVGVKI